MELVVATAAYIALLMQAVLEIRVKIQVQTQIKWKLKHEVDGKAGELFFFLALNHI